MLAEMERGAGGKKYLRRVFLLVLTVLGACLFVAGLPRLGQDGGYHLFADTGSFLGIVNGSNVLSNAGFVVAGAAGLARTRGAAFSTTVLIWRSFFAAIIFVGLGSAYYHWSPDNGSLLWDRLPMTIGFASLVAGICAERLGPHIGRLVFGPLLLTGISSVLYWRFTESIGVGDLRPYILVQYLPMLLAPLMIRLFPRERAYNRPYWILLVGYIIAKGFELQDAAVYVMTGQLVSGHTLKHLAAAAGLLMFRPIVHGGSEPADQPGANVIDKTGIIFYNKVNER